MRMKNDYFVVVCFLEPYKRSARQRTWKRTDPTLDQDCKTESNCVNRVSVDNKCGFQRISSRDNCTLDARLVSKTRTQRETNVSEMLSR